MLNSSKRRSKKKKIIGFYFKGICKSFPDPEKC